MMAHSRRVPARFERALRAACHVASLAAALELGACSRSGLELGEVDLAESSGGAAAGGAAAGGTPSFGGAESFGGATASGGARASGGAETTCTPSREECNGHDDDCDGQIDEVPALPCPFGGFRYCVGGRMSACPKRCDVCVPGSERICFVNFCTFWGTQTCAADGRGFGSCREERPDAACKQFASDPKRLDELEQCCLDRGYCCVDSEDLDHDGNRSEMLGHCQDVTCE